MFNGKTHYIFLWPFSIAMLNYQRVYPSISQYYHIILPFYNPYKTILNHMKPCKTTVNHIKPYKTICKTTGNPWPFCPCGRPNRVLCSFSGDHGVEQHRHRGAGESGHRGGLHDGTPRMTSGEPMK